MKKIIIASAAVVVIVVGYFIYQSRQTYYSLAAVEHGSIVQQVLANGNVESPTTIDLRFQNVGKLIALDADVGKSVAAGDVLAKEDSSVLGAKLAQAQAAIAAAQAKLDDLAAGTRPEEIQLDETAVAQANQILVQEYAGIPGILQTAYINAVDAVQKQTDPLFSNPESTNPQLSFVTNDSQAQIDSDNERQVVNSELVTWKLEIDALGVSPADALLDQTLQNGSAHLAKIQTYLNRLSAALVGQITLSQSTITSYQGYLTTAQTEITSGGNLITTAQQTVSADRLAVTKAQGDLNLARAGSTPATIREQQAAVAEAQANAAAIEAQIRETALVAPSAGTITQTKGDIGENVTPDMTIISLIPKSALEIKLNVSEDNIVGVQVAQHAVITLDAFPGVQTWSGRVVSIDPAQTIVSGAVYYQTTVLFDKIDPSVKPGMSATVYIQTGYATSTLMVPASAIQMNGVNTFVQVYQSGKTTNQAVMTGLKDKNGMVEITSGLSEGQQVVTGK